MESHDEYATYVEHPRFGRGPRFTDVTPEPELLGYRLTTYLSAYLIPGTAIEADLEHQTPSPVPVLYYFDLKRVCINCKRPFIFFAEEQKHWYETLGFTLDSACVRCVPCRKRQQSIASTRKRYEELVHVPDPTIEEHLEMAECCMSLIEASVFDRRQTERVRMLLNRMQTECGETTQSRYDDLRARVVAMETHDGSEPGDTPEP